MVVESDDSTGSAGNTGMTTFKAIIFDVDGTLSETEEIHRQAFNETFDHFGLDWRWTQNLYRELLLVSGGKERIRHFLDRSGIVPVQFPDELTIVLHAFKTERYVRLLESGQFDLRPGVREIIDAAQRNGSQLAIATTTSRENVECLIAGAFGPDGLGMFASIVCGDDVARKKPAPDVYLRVIERLGLAASECVAIEDSRNGMLAAQGAGIAVAITPAFYTGDDDFSGANWIFGEKGLEASVLGLR